MVCVVYSCCATSPYREVCRAMGGIESGETLCHDIYLARPITTVSLAANTYCMMDGLSLGSSLAARVNTATDDRPAHAAGCHCFEQRLILSVSKFNINQRSQMKEDTVRSH